MVWEEKANGIRGGRSAAPGSEGSKGSEGKVDGASPRRLWPPAAAGCVEGGGDGPSGRGLWYRRFAAMSFIGSVTGLPFVSPVLQAEVLVPPFLWKGGVAVRRRRIGASVLGKYSDLSSGLRPAPFQSGRQKESPFMDRLRANFGCCGDPLQGLHNSEGSRHLTIMRQMLLNTSRREGAAFCGSPPLVPAAPPFPLTGALCVLNSVPHISEA